MTTAGHRRPSIWSRLYRGETSFDFVGRRRIWLSISAVVIAAGMAAVGIRGLNFGIDFSGGTSWQVQTAKVGVTQARNALGALGRNATIVTLGNGSSKTLQVEAKLAGSAASQAATRTSVAATLARLAHVSPSSVSTSDVGPTWGGQITSKAIRALIIFFVAIGLYITLRFEWKMATAALVAVLHDLVVTVGIYALVGFPVTPATVVAVLTILGYSLYDTIVVFDRVQENSRGLGATGRLTYSDTVNLSMNQVLMRSLNTSIVAILPILSVLLIGAELLGATTLQEFGLALVIGLTTGAYSSIFIASPLLAMLKEREPRYLAIRRKLEARGEGPVLLTPAAVAAMAGAGTGVANRSQARARPESAGRLVPKAARARAANQAGAGPGRAGDGSGRPGVEGNGVSVAPLGGGRAAALEGSGSQAGGQPGAQAAGPAGGEGGGQERGPAVGEGGGQAPAAGGRPRPQLRPPPSRPSPRPRKKSKRR